MKAVIRKEPGTISTTARVLLRELRGECERAVAVIRRLEKANLSDRDQDEVLGELSAAVLHLHTHTEGLDEFLCERA